MGVGREKDAGHGELGKKMTEKLNMAKMHDSCTKYI